MNDHARARAKERYGVDLSDADIAEMVRLIQAGYALMLGQARNPRGQYLVPHGNRKYRVVYSRPTGMIVTFLPLTEERGPRPKPQKKAKPRVKMVYRAGRMRPAG